ncbi:hypothetical protein T01_14178 [Trichinella spiralis]|uniref:Uncharacterized protein n=1 Tax=Trichinella spiralis TaxID=6334 RepID=A0A0V1B8P0_TRISP|nr:hypothetical protein T01_14178 [Trichinella spiralis]
MHAVDLQGKGKRRCELEIGLRQQAIPDTCPDGSTSPDMSGMHIFRVSRLHSLQHPCGPVPRIWFTPSNWMSGNCDIKPDAALGDEIRSDRWKPTRPCRRNTKGLCDLSSMKQ